MNWNELHRFWFGDITLTHEYFERQMNRWFRQTYPRFDWVCRNEFLPWLYDLKELPKDLCPKDYLALILLHDQIPRNSFREDKQAFAWDHVAQELTLNALGTKLETSLSLPEKLFLYMPLEHAENLKLQELSVEKFFEAHKEAPKEIRDWTRICLEYAIEHQMTIKKHGHFPHRDQVRDYREPPSI